MRAPGNKILGEALGNLRAPTRAFDVISNFNKIGLRGVSEDEAWHLGRIRVLHPGSKVRFEVGANLVDAISARIGDGGVQGLAQCRQLNGIVDCLLDSGEVPLLHLRSQPSLGFGGKLEIHGDNYRA